MVKCPENVRLNLPCDTAIALNKIRLEVDNLYLMHNRFSYLKGENKPKSESLLKFLYDKTKISNKFDGLSVFKKNKELLPTLNERTLNLASSYGCVERFCYVPLDKLMIGSGGASPYSNLQLLTLHPLYGVPYIPATAIKGMLSRYWSQEVKKDNNNDFNKMFGVSDESDDIGKQRMTGELVFFDTFPQEYALGFDALTPHYQDYYQSGGKIPPTDDLNPKPLIFPYVKNAKFHIYIACKDADLAKRLSANFSKNLCLAFQCYGVGAKTAYGYG